MTKRDFRNADLSTLHEWEAEYHAVCIREEERIGNLRNELFQAELARDNARFLRDKTRWWIGEKETK